MNSQEQKNKEAVQDKNVKKAAEEQETKDSLALIVGGIFVLGLVFATFTYFNKSTPTNTEPGKENGTSESLVDKIKKFFSTPKGDDANKVTEIPGNNNEDGEDTDKDNEKQLGDINGDGHSTKATDNKDSLNGDAGSTGITNSDKTTGAWVGVWVANDYKYGDIKGGSYTIKSGDTLWEIAEGVYGNGADWTKILAANSSKVGFLPNGEQALIFPGQVLVLP